MDVEIFCICEHASFSDGKLSIISVFDLIEQDFHNENFPLFYLACKIAYTSAESGKDYYLKLSTVGPDSQIIGSEFQQAFFVKPAGDMEQSSFQFLTKYENLNVSKPGTYTFNLIINSEKIKSTKVYVRGKVQK